MNWAMKIGSKYNFVEVMARHWEQFATEAGLSRAPAKLRVLDIVKRLPALARATQAKLQSHDKDHPVIDQTPVLQSSAPS